MAGVAPGRVYVELFNGSEPMTPGVVGAVSRPPHPPEHDASTGALVSFARSGIAAHWNATAYQSLLELAEACDVPVRWSCRTGVCHNCGSAFQHRQRRQRIRPQPLDCELKQTRVKSGAGPRRDDLSDRLLGEAERQCPSRHVNPIGLAEWLYEP